MSKLPCSQKKYTVFQKKPFVAIHSSYSQFSFLACSCFGSDEETISDIRASVKQTLVPFVTWALDHNEGFIALKLFFVRM
jgi:hypothetical protein